MPEPVNRASYPVRIPPSATSRLARASLADDSWTVFGTLTVVAFLLGGAFCVWKAFPEASRSPVSVSPATLSAPSAARPAPPSVMRSSQVADQPLSWQDLTLMLRSGMRDDEVIAAINDGRQLVFTVGDAEAITLRRMGAGNRLLELLRASPIYAAPAANQPPGISVPGPVSVRTPPRTPVPPRIANISPSLPAPTPVDYVAKERKIKTLQMQIDRLDEQILNMRNHPDSYPYMGTYNGGGYHYGEESPLKKSFDQLDNQRNELRREKWRLEGR